MRVRDLEQKTCNYADIQQELTFAKQFNQQLQQENQKLLAIIGQQQQQSQQEREIPKPKEQFEAFSVSYSTLNWHFYQEEGEEMLPFFASEDESSLYSHSMPPPLSALSASPMTFPATIKITTVPCKQ